MDDVAVAEQLKHDPDRAYDDGPTDDLFHEFRHLGMVGAALGVGKESDQVEKQQKALKEIAR